MKERLIKKLMASLKCEECGQHYEADNVDVIGHREEMWFMRVNCATCHTQCLVAAVVREGKAPGKTEDFAAVGIEGHAGEVITADDMLDMHNFLADFDGDFSRLFGQEKLR